MAQPKRRATYQDLIDLPENRIGEIVGGELYSSPRPASPHAHAVMRISSDLTGFEGPPGDARGPGGWCLLFEPELHFGEDVLVPDLAGWRIERMPAVPNVPFFELAPDWVCEVISPSTGRLDRVRKMPVYARESVPNLWFVDPLQQTLEIYALEKSRWMLTATHGDAEVIRATPFEAVEIELRRWWLKDV